MADLATPNALPTVGTAFHHSRPEAIALGGMISEAAWRMKPSWYMVTSEDRMIPPQAQKSMAERTGATVSEAAASHSVYVSQPAAVAALITQAAAATSG